MKNKSAVLVSLGIVFLCSVAYAASSVRGGKAYVSTYGSTSPVIVTKTPGVVYSVTLGTGAVTDYVVLLDSANATAATAASQAGGYKLRVHAASATQNTTVVFDPPLQFVNGITAVNATGVMTSVISYESGRVTSGY